LFEKALVYVGVERFEVEVGTWPTDEKGEAGGRVWERKGWRQGE
jgi:hypothetical protein